MAWHEWHQGDLPCQFSPERAQENKSFLERLLGDDFVRDQEARRKANPLLAAWDTGGAITFLEVNGLAEDLREVEGKPGLSSVVSDLRDERLCLPTWHMIHTAALFERARSGAVLEFVVAGGDEAPDLVVDIAGDRVPVEAKLLTQSEDELRFISVARSIHKALTDDDAVIPGQTGIYVILKEPVGDDVSREAIELCLEALARHQRGAACERRRLCNVFLEPAPAVPGISDYRVVYIMAPVPATEDLRVLARAKKASNQLRSLPSSLDSGILSVGLTENQDGAAVFANVSERIRRGRFGGISAILLLKRRTYLAAPRRTTLDLLEYRTNPTADHPLRGRVALLPLGAAALLTQSEPHLSGIRAYRLGTATGRVTDPGKVSLPLPDLRVLTPDLIE